VKRWIRAVLERWLSLLLPGSERVRPPLLSAFDPAYHREDLLQSLGQVVRMPTIAYRLIRDGPMGCRQQPGGWLQDDHREAA
jgi:hypothetical protein